MVLLESQVKLKTGDLAPDFELLGIDDKKHKLDDYKDYKGFLVIFMCNHCPYVKAKVDALNELHEKCGSDIAMIGINSNDSTDYPEDSFEAMKETIEAIEKAGLRHQVKIMIGGGMVDEHIRAYTGADAYGGDAMAAVSLVKNWTGKD